jgi:hypothetical protein
MGLTKQQLEALNISSFPNNTAGLITPDILRTYNSSSIEATVNQDVYTADSASFNTRINAITGSSVNTSSLVTTASFNAYTASQDFKNTTFATTSSLNAVSTSVGLLQTFSGSQYKTDSASFDSRILAITGSGGSIYTGSFAITGSNTFTGSQTINGGNVTFGTTGSVVTNGISWPMASIYQNNFLNFATNGAIGIDFSANGGGSGNNINFRNTNIGGAVQFTTTDGQIKLVGGNAGLGGVGSQVSLTGSAVLIQNVDFIPFSSSVDSRLNGFATTGSNSFVGNQTITGSVTISGSATSDLTVVGQIFVSSSATSGATAVPRITVSGSNGTTIINRNSINVANSTNAAVLNPQFISANIIATNDEIGFSVDAAGGGIAGWTTGPAIYVNNDIDDTYPAVFGFQDKANYTDGRVTVLTPLVVSSSMDFYAHDHKQFNVGAFQSNITQSGSANVSQSMNFETTDISKGVSIASNSRITLANAGTYNIQFSAQVLADTGADTVWIWLKKNGTNVSSTSTKLVLANNEANVAAWNFVVDAAAADYFELVWQSNGGHTKLLTEAAAGNYPAIPSIILTVTQVR